MDYSEETSWPVANVLGRLHGVLRLGPGWYEAVCPVHNDVTKPLRVIEGADGRAHIECENGCWLSEILPVLRTCTDHLFECIDDIYFGDASYRFPSPLSASSAEEP